jgi:hypothetical protein
VPAPVAAAIEEELAAPTKWLADIGAGEEQPLVSTNNSPPLIPREGKLLL